MKFDLDERHWVLVCPDCLRTLVQRHIGVPIYDPYSPDRPQPDARVEKALSDYDAGLAKDWLSKDHKEEIMQELSRAQKSEASLLRKLASLKEGGAQ